MSTFTPPSLTASDRALVLRDASGTSSHPVPPLLDALPYIDPEPIRAGEIDTLIQSEVNGLPNQPPLENKHEFSNTLLREGFAGTLDTKRYQLPLPQEKAGLKAMEKALKNAQSQVMHQQLQLMNLELMLRYGPSQWTTQNHQLSTIATRLESQARSLKSQIDHVNKTRKLKQMEIGSRVEKLQKEWVERAHETMLVRCANECLEEEIEELERVVGSF